MMMVKYPIALIPRLTVASSILPRRIIAPIRARIPIPRPLISLPALPAFSPASRVVANNPPSAAMTIIAFLIVLPRLVILTSPSFSRVLNIAVIDKIPSRRAAEFLSPSVAFILPIMTLKDATDITAAVITMIADAGSLNLMSEIDSSALAMIKIEADIASKFFAAVFVDLILPLASLNLVMLEFIWTAAKTSTPTNVPIARVESISLFGSTSSRSLNAEASAIIEIAKPAMQAVMIFTADIAVFETFGNLPSTKMNSKNAVMTPASDIAASSTFSLGSSASNPIDAARIAMALAIFA